MWYTSKLRDAESCVLMHTTNMHIYRAWLCVAHGSCLQSLTSQFLFSLHSQVSLTISIQGRRRCGLATACARSSVTCSRVPSTHTSHHHTITHITPLSHHHTHHTITLSHHHTITPPSHIHGCRLCAPTCTGINTYTTTHT